MRVVIVGLGIQGRKRRAIAGPDAVASVDPVNREADHRNLSDVPLADYDAALVCTPDAAKLDLLAYLLENGKHVLVEKPLLAPNTAVLERLAALARSRGAICYTAYNHRFEPHLARVREVLDEGTLGTVYLARFFYGNGTARDVRNSAWRDQGLHQRRIIRRPPALMSSSAAPGRWGCNRRSRAADRVAAAAPPSRA